MRLSTENRRQTLYAAEEYAQTWDDRMPGHGMSRHSKGEIKASEVDVDTAPLVRPALVLRGCLSSSISSRSGIP